MTIPEVCYRSYSPTYICKHIRKYIKTLDQNVCQEDRRIMLSAPFSILHVCIYINFGLGFQFHDLPPGSTAASVAYCTIPRFSKRSYFGRQVPLASTTRGSPLAAKGVTMGEKWWPNGAWAMHPGFFYMPQICETDNFTCWGFLSPFKYPTASALVWTREFGYQRSARYLCTTTTCWFTNMSDIICPELKCSSQQHCKPKSTTPSFFA